MQRRVQSSFASSTLIGLVIAAVILGLLVYAGLFAADRSPVQAIINRYVEQLHAGNGMVFNPSERVLLVPSPIYILALALLNVVLPATTASALLFAVASLAGAISLYLLARRAELPELPSLLLMGLFMVLAIFLDVMNPPAVIAAALTLIALEVALAGRWSLAGLILAMGVLCNPVVALLAVPLLLPASEKEQGLQFLLPFLIPLLVVGVLMRLYYGPGWLEGLLLSTSSFSADSRLWIAWLVGAALIGYGWYRQRPNLVITLCCAWIMLYIFIFGVLLHAGPGWLDLFMLGPLLLVISWGLQTIDSRLSWAFGAILIVLAVLGISGLVSAQPQPAPLTAITTAPNASVVGVANPVEHLRPLPAPNQSIVALDGELQPDLKAMSERGDIQAILLRYAPDVLSIQGSAQISRSDLATNAVAQLDYRPSGTPQIYLRHSSVGQFKDYPAQASYGPDISLTGLGVDQSTLKPGQLLRVRLEWQFARAATRPVTIDLWLRSGDYLLAHARDTFEPGIFRAGPWSTYHTLSVFDRAWSGPVVLEAAVIVSQGTIALAPLATLEISGR